MVLKPIVSMPATAGSNYSQRGQGLQQWLLGSNRWVLGLALAFAIVLPELLHPFVNHLGPWFDTRERFPESALIAAALAIIGAHMSLQRLGILPLVSSRSLILPTFLVAFGAVTLVLYAMRVDAGRYHVWTAGAIGLAWYYLVSLARGRLLRPVIGLVGVPHDFAGELADNITCQVIETPRLPPRISAVVVDPHASFTVEWSRFLTGLVLEGLPVYHRSHLEEGLTGRVRFDTHADNNFGALLPSLTYLRLKRLLDLGAGLVSLPLVLPAILVAALVIRLDSPGPAFFSQLRTGHRGRPFTCYKLRTMRIDVGGPSFTLENDARITRVGRFMRKWRIDELPQVFNIYKGEMSWIGPRPEAVELARHYAAHVPFYDYRHAVRPGLTGWAAVHQGNVAEVDAARLKLEYDFYYIKYFSIWLDFMIVLKTLQTVWSGFGSR